MAPGLTERGAGLLYVAVMCVVLGAVHRSLPFLWFGAGIAATLVGVYLRSIALGLRLRHAVSMHWEGDFNELLRATLHVPVDAHLIVRNESAATLPWLKIEALTTHGLQVQVGEGGPLTIGAASVVRVAVRLQGLRLGDRRIHALRLSLKDATGCVTSTALVPLAARVLVVPAVVPMTRLVRAWRQLTVEPGGRAAFRGGEGQDFRELRPWQAGDSMRRVAWRASAREAALVVRVMEEERQRTLMFLLDVSPSMQGGEPLQRLDHVISVTWCAVSLANHPDDAVGVATFSDRLVGSLPAARGARHRALLGDHLLLLANLPHPAVCDWPESELARMLLDEWPLREVLLPDRVMAAEGQESTHIRAMLAQAEPNALPALRGRLVAAGFPVADEPTLAELAAARGIQLPARADARPGPRAAVLCALLQKALSLRVGAEVLVLTDLLDAEVVETIAQSVERLTASGRRVSFLVPWVPSYVSAVSESDVQDALKTLFAMPYARGMRSAMERLRRAGATVTVFRADEDPVKVVGRMVLQRGSGR
jgi:uncharacterized protein (DUF58 family)